MINNLTDWAVVSLVLGVYSAIFGVGFAKAFGYAKLSFILCVVSPILVLVDIVICIVIAQTFGAAVGGFLLALVFVALGQQFGFITIARPWFGPRAVKP